MVRSGSEPPVLRAEGMRGTLAGWSGDGKMLGGGHRERSSARDHLLHHPPAPQPQKPRAGAAQPRTYWIPGTSQERGRAEDEESCEIREKE